MHIHERLCRCDYRFSASTKNFPGAYEMDHSYFFWQAVCYLELKNYSEAEKYFKKDILIETNGDTPKTAHFNSLFYFGVLYYEMKRYDLAKTYLLKCLAQYTQHPIANYYLGMAYKEERDYALEKQYLQIAREAFKKGYSINEDNEFYANFPHQIRVYEVEQAISRIK